MMKLKFKILMLMVMVVIFMADSACAQIDDLEIVHTETQEIVDKEGSVKLRLDWLKRPGEMALTINYNGYLTQEGMVNCYITVNGEAREFITMRQELKNRAQRTRILSFHPTIKEKDVNRLAQLPEDTLVDSLLFRNAPYYKQFGTVNIEIIFFCHSRWDGDSNNNNENYRFSFASPIADFSVDHF